MQPAEPVTSRPVRRRTERFDINSVTIKGQITKIWARGSDVYARLRILDQDASEKENHRFTNIRLPQGTIHGQELSLQGNEIMRLSAFILHTSFEETLRRFLDLAECPEFLDVVPKNDLKLWRDIMFIRHNSMLNVRRATLFDPESGKLIQSFAPERTYGSPLDPDNIDVQRNDTPSNKVIIEGIAARVWEIPRRSSPIPDKMLRIAVYDRFAPIDRHPEAQGSFGLPRRKPHYVNIFLPAGKTTTGYDVDIELKDRVRITGQIGSRSWSVTLREALMETGSSDVVAAMQRLGEHTDMLDRITTQQEAAHVEANAIIKYSSGSPN